MIYLEKNNILSVYISSPLKEFGIFDSRGFGSFNLLGTEFKTVGTKLCSPIIIGNKFKMLSPLVCSIKNEKGQYYLRPYDKEIGEVLKNNLINKYEVFNKKDCYEFGFNIISNPQSKLIKVKDIFVKAFYANIELTGSRELTETALLCGLGEKNSQGFGMIEPIF
jgi:CRISPR-associated endoribonuclease Cas6